MPLTPEDQHEVAQAIALALYALRDADPTLPLLDGPAREEFAAALRFRADRIREAPVGQWAQGCATTILDVYRALLHHSSEYPPVADLGD